MADSDLDVKESKDKLMKRFKYITPENKWTKVKMENTIDLTGKRLHLFQLPPDFPVENLDGMEIPMPKKRKWSAPINVTYNRPVTRNAKATQLTQETVEIKCRRLDEQTETIFHVIDGKLKPYEGHVQNLCQGYGVITPAAIELPEKKDSKHELPAGLRQRFTPTGNKPFSTVSVTPAQLDLNNGEDTEPKSKISRKDAKKMTYS